jgi:hypothetical protein
MFEKLSKRKSNSQFTLQEKLPIKASTSTARVALLDHFQEKQRNAKTNNIRQHFRQYAHILSPNFGLKKTNDE